MIMETSFVSSKRWPKSSSPMDHQFYHHNHHCNPIHITTTTTTTKYRSTTKNILKLTNQILHYLILAIKIIMMMIIIPVDGIILMANCEPQLWNNNHYQQQKQHSYYNTGSSPGLISNYSLPTITTNDGVGGGGGNSINNINFFNQNQNNPNNHFIDYIACAKHEINGLITNVEPNHEPHGFRIKIQSNPDKYVPNEMYTSKLSLSFLVKIPKFFVFSIKN